MSRNHSCGASKLPRIIVTFAVGAEFAPWRRKRKFLLVRSSEVPKYSGEYDNAEVCVLITGIGMRHAHAELPKILAEPADACVVCGLAGSLRAQHEVGTILAARAVKRDNTETVMNSADSLVQIAAAQGATAVDFFHTSDSVLVSASEKLRLAETADAVDMESFQVMAEALKCGVPAVAVRAVSDAADRDLPFDFNQAIDEAGKIEWFPMLSQIAASPWRLPEMVRFGFGSSKASRNLAIFLDRYLSCLAADAIFEANRWHWEAG